MIWQRRKGFKYKKGDNYAQVTDFKETGGLRNTHKHTYPCNSMFVRTFVDIIYSKIQSGQSQSVFADYYH